MRSPRTVCRPSPTDAARPLVRALELTSNRGQSAFGDWASFMSDALLIQGMSSD